MTEQEVRVVPVSRQLRDQLADVVEQMRRETRPIFADAVDEIVTAYDQQGGEQDADGLQAAG